MEKEFQKTKNLVQGSHMLLYISRQIAHYCVF